MNRTGILSLCAGTLCAGFATITMPTAVLANTVNPSSLEQKAIVFNQQVISKPYGFVHDKTTYMPIWYLMQTLDKLGIKSTWNNNTWTLIAPNVSNLKPVTSANGSSSISINGITVEKMNELTAVDPSSNKTTTYMPAWYVMQVLNKLNIHSNWNGSIWQIYTGTAAPSIGQLDIQLKTRPPAARSAPSLGQEIVQYAKKYIGTPYRWGGKSTSGFDCSGFVQYVFNHFSLSLPRTANEQAHVGSVVGRSNLKPGDLVYFDTTGAPFSHVGIYAGNNKFISATSSHGVQIRSLTSNVYWAPRFTRSTNPGI